MRDPLTPRGWLSVLMLRWLNHLTWWASVETIDTRISLRMNDGRGRVAECIVNVDQARALADALNAAADAQAELAARQDQLVEAAIDAAASST